MPERRRVLGPAGTELADIGFLHRRRCMIQGRRVALCSGGAWQYNKGLRRAWKAAQAAAALRQKSGALWSVASGYWVLSGPGARLALSLARGQHGQPIQRQRMQRHS